MAEPSREDAALVAKAAAMIIGRLDDNLAEITRVVQEMLVDEVSEIAADGELVKVVHHSVQGNLDAYFAAVRNNISIDDVEPPTAALEHARRMAQRGVSANALVRAYRLGHQALISMVLDEIRTARLDPGLGLDVLHQIGSTSFRYIDKMSQLALDAYQLERDHWLANQNRVRAMRVREVLHGDDIDVDETSNAIRYPLRRSHLSLIVWCGESDDDDELVAMERFVGELGRLLGARERPLFIAADRVTGWAWIPLSADASPNLVAQVRAFAEAQANAPWIAVGPPLPGIEGFRRSHQQALATRGAVIASGPRPPRVTAASDPGIAVVAQFSGDLRTARAWVGEMLGPLASATDVDERLRETLRVFLRTNSSFKAAADELHLHSNSVKYRVQRALERRGRPITDDRLDVEVALLLCHWFDTAVLMDAQRLHS
jgi:DNA-binding PucR family transcriptional regulator